jgi:hypothetical protein
VTLSCTASSSDVSTSKEFKEEGLFRESLRILCGVCLITVLPPPHLIPSRPDILEFTKNNCALLTTEGLSADKGANEIATIVMIYFLITQATSDIVVVFHNFHNKNAQQNCQCHSLRCTQEKPSASQLLRLIAEPHH